MVAEVGGDSVSAGGWLELGFPVGGVEPDLPAGVVDDGVVARQSMTRLFKLVVQSSAQCSMWWASQATGGRRQLGNA